MTWLLCAIIGGFILQLVLSSAWFGGNVILQNQFGLSGYGLRQGRIWTLISHAFLHQPGNIFHVVTVSLTLYFVGNEILPLVGSRRFLGLFFGATVIGGLAWALTHWHVFGVHLGSMAAVYALLVVFACFYPNRQMDFLLFFVLPVRLRPKHLVFALLGIDLIGLVAYEIYGAARPLAQISFAHSAHLGGMLTGWTYFRFMHETRSLTRRAAKPGDREDLSDSDAEATETGPASIRNLRAETDRILDKINSHGLASLSPDERRVLDEARNSLSQR